MQFDKTLIFEEQEISIENLLKIFDDPKLKKQYEKQIQMKNVQDKMIKGIMDVNKFLGDNTAFNVEKIEIDVVKEAFEICLKKYILDRGIHMLMHNGMSNLINIIQQEKFNEETVKKISVEAYLMILRVEIYNSPYLIIKNAMMKLKDLY